jgi:hypothetical protein
MPMWAYTAARHIQLDLGKLCPAVGLSDLRIEKIDLKKFRSCLSILEKTHCLHMLEYRVSRILEYVFSLGVFALIFKSVSNSVIIIA